MLLYILLFIAVLFILAQAYLLYIFINRITELAEENDAYDKGMSEVTDAYESDSLQYEETIENLHEQFNEERATWARNAEIDRVARHEQTRTIEELLITVGTVRGENLHLRTQLDVAQRIILEHDMNCLPHIVLSSMEGEKDTPLPLDCEHEACDQH
jgi:hypothetical protein